MKQTVATCICKENCEDVLLVRIVYKNIFAVRNCDWFVSNSALARVFLAALSSLEIF